MVDHNKKQNISPAEWEIMRVNFSVAKFTDAFETPESFEVAFSIVSAHEAHVIPSISYILIPI